jgi:flagellar basal-body rod protein FlgB
MPSAGNPFGLDGGVLKIRQQRLNMIASNIANAATPGYKARDLDFSEALRRAENGQSIDGATRYRAPLQPSLDGNTVELVNEQMEFTENALAYRASLQFMKGRVDTLRRALKGE